MNSVPGSRTAPPATRRILAFIRNFAVVVLSTLSIDGRIARATTYTVCSTGCNYTSIQSAINASTTTGHTILVASGTYRLSSRIHLTDKDASSPAQPTILKADGQVIIDCADDFSDSAWTQHTGNVYKASRAASLMDPPATQVHVDDVRYTFESDTGSSTFSSGHAK